MSTPIRQEIVRLARARSTALVRKDRSKMEEILSPEFTYTNASGELLSREEYLVRYVESSEVRWEVQSLEEVRVELIGPVATLNCLVHDIVWFGGQRVDAYFDSTFTFRRHLTGWRCTSGSTRNSEPDQSAPRTGADVRR